MHGQKESEACCFPFNVKAFAFLVLIPWGGQHLASINLLTSESPRTFMFRSLVWVLAMLSRSRGQQAHSSSHRPLGGLWRSLWSVPTPTASCRSHSELGWSSKAPAGATLNDRQWLFPRTAAKWPPRELISNNLPSYPEALDKNAHWRGQKSPRFCF